MCRLPRGLLSTSGNGPVASWSGITGSPTLLLSSRRQRKISSVRPRRPPIPRTVRSTPQLPGRSPSREQDTSLLAITTLPAQIGRPHATTLLLTETRPLIPVSSGEPPPTRYPRWQVTATVPAMAAHPPPTPSTYPSAQLRLPARYLHRRCGRTHRMTCGENPLERCGDNIHMGCRRIRHTTCEHADSVCFCAIGKNLG